MKKHKFIYGCMLCIDILKKTDILSKALQNGEISAAEGHALAEAVVRELRSERSDERFDEFWHKVEGKCSELSIDDPTVPRNTKDPVKIFYKKLYFEAYDTIINTINNRFDQTDFKTYQNIEELLLKAVRRTSFENELNEVCTFYEGDFKKSVLAAELSIFGNLVNEDDRKGLNIKKLISLLQSLHHVQKILLPQVVLLARFMLVTPATNAVSECSFLALKLVKTYLRSVTSDRRLNHEMLIYVHKHATDRIDLIDVGREFVTREDVTRKRLFGEFRSSDIVIGPKKHVNASTQTNARDARTSNSK